MAKPVKSIHDLVESSSKEQKDPTKKLHIIEESFHKGILGQEEYEREKQKIMTEVEEHNKKREEDKKKELEEEPKKSSERNLIIAIVVLLIMIVALFGFARLSKQEPKTIGEMHSLNFQGKLDPRLGYIYHKVYSFVTVDGLWYTQLQSPKGTKDYNLALRYSPRELENISIGGFLNASFFDNQTHFYTTFNPKGNDFAHVALAVSDFNTHMAKVFEKNPIAACDRNETLPCFSRPIVTCNDTEKLVFYVKEADNFNAYYNGNCIVIEGTGFDLVKGADRVLYNLYGIMDQKKT